MRLSFPVLATAGGVRDNLMDLRDILQADELMAITITGDYDNRMKSYLLLAQAFGLCQRD